MGQLLHIRSSRVRARPLRAPKKRALVLFELLIALSLTAILLTFLFSFFVQSAKIEKKLDKARVAIGARSHLQTRLQTVFSSIRSEGLKAPFYTKRLGKEKSESLVMVFNQGIDPDPAYSGAVLGKIYLDEEKNLSLAIWPLRKEKKMLWRKEILLSQVDSFRFEFLGKVVATEHGKTENISPITPVLAWRGLWPKSTQEIPSMIRLKVEQKGDQLEFAFLLPESWPLVTYREKKI